MPIISAVGLFCFDKFEDNQTRKFRNFFLSHSKINLTLADESGLKVGYDHFLRKFYTK